jgi:antitoxin YefM
MDAVCDTRDALIVTRQNARSVVLLSADEYESLMETLHLLQSPRNAARLLSAVEDADAGKVTEHDLVEGQRGNAA